LDFNIDFDWKLPHRKTMSRQVSRMRNHNDHREEIKAKVHRTDL